MDFEVYLDCLWIVGYMWLFVVCRLRGCFWRVCCFAVSVQLIFAFATLECGLVWLAF